MSINSTDPPTMRIGSRLIADSEPCYVIAEIGHNHQGSVEKAKGLFEAAKNAGADAVKLQKRDNRSLYVPELFDKPYDNENSFGHTYGEHREALELGRDEYRELQEFAAEIEIEFFATAFDQPSVDFLEELDMPAYKVASGDIRNLPLLRYLAQTGKPIICSTGGAALPDVERAYETLRDEANGLAVLQCTAGYPAAWDELDLRVIETYRSRFPEAVIGFSSHDNGIAMPLAGYVLGARIIEKHFTMDRTWRGTDHKFSLEPLGLSKLVRDLRRAHVAMGNGTKRIHESERAPIEKMAKKLVAVRDLPTGHELAADDLAAKSPGNGLAPSYLDVVVGRRLRAPLPENMALTLDLLEPVGEPVVEELATQLSTRQEV